MAGCCRRSRRLAGPGRRHRRRPLPPPRTWPVRCGARRPPTASTRSASAPPTRTGPTGTPRTWWRSRPGRSCRRERLRRDRSRRRGARRALRGGAGRARAARRGRRARAGRRRVLLLGVHSVEDAAAPGRGGAGRARRRRDRAGRRRGGARLAGLHGVGLLRRRPGALAGGPAASTCCAAEAGSRASASSRSRTSATPRSTSWWRPAQIRSCRRSRTARAPGRVGQPRGDRA